MLLALILLIILVSVIAVYFATNGPLKAKFGMGGENAAARGVSRVKGGSNENHKLRSEDYGIYGGGILYRTFNETYEKVIEKYPDSVDIKEYNKVNILENKKIFMDLFGPLGVYKQYPGKTLNGHNIEYIQTLINSEELEYEPQICDLHDHLDMSYAPQGCRFHKDGEERAINQTLDNYQNGYRKLLTNMFEVLFLLPVDAIAVPAANAAPKYNVLVLRATPGGHVLFCAQRFKNVRFVVYDKDPLYFTDLPSNMEYVASSLENPEDLAGKFDVVYLNVWAYRMLPEELAAGYNYICVHDSALIDDYIIKLRPKIGAVCRFVPPQYEEKQLKERIAVIPSPTEYRTIGGIVLFQPYANKATTECVIIRTADDIKRGLEPYNYERHEAEALAFNLRRVWCTYRPIIKLPGRPDIDITDLRNISIYDRCLDCTMFAHYMARYIDRYEPANYSYARLEALILEAESVHALETDITKNIDMLTNPNKKKYDLHGLYKHLNRVQHHARFVELFTEFIKPITDNKMVIAHMFNKEALDKLKTGTNPQATPPPAQPVVTSPAQPKAKPN